MDRFIEAEALILDALKQSPRLSDAQLHKIGKLEEGVETRRLLDQLVRDGILLSINHAGVKCFTRNPALDSDDPPPSPVPPTPEPPPAPAKSPAEIPAPAVATLAAREAFMHKHQKQSTPLAINAVPKAPEAMAPSPAEAAAPAPADHIITICRLETFSPLEAMMQEMLVYRLRRYGLREAREAGHSSVTVVYVDEAGDVVSRETVRF